MQTRFVTIRASKDGYFPAYLALFTAYEKEIGLNLACSEEKLLRRVDREGGHALHAMIFVGETAAGFVHAHLDQESGAGWIFSFYVLPCFRCRGLGRELAVYGETWLNAAGAREILLTPEISAQVFWQRAGYVPTGRKDPVDGAEIWKKSN